MNGEEAESHRARAARPGGNQPQRRYRVAVAGGAGFWGAYYLRAFSRNPDCEIVALVDTAEERRVEVARDYGIPDIYGSVDDLLTVEVPDILSTSLPVAASYGAVLAAAEAGVGVVTCEKPLSENLSKADEMVNVCRERGVPFVCGTALWEIKHLDKVSGWIGEGHIGKVLSASLSSGLPDYVSGNGCVPLNWLRMATGREVEWVEGGQTWPAEAAATDDDCGVSGTMGLSGGMICDIPAPPDCEGATGGIHIEGSQGCIEIVSPEPVFTVGIGGDSSPVVPTFCVDTSDEKQVDWLFRNVTENIVSACRTGGEALCSGHDYRQVLEIAVAFKLSARAGGRRIHLPLSDRNQILKPAPWRMLGGDVAGWISGLEPPAHTQT